MIDTARRKRLLNRLPRVYFEEVTIANSQQSHIIKIRLFKVKFVPVFGNLIQYYQFEYTIRENDAYPISCVENFPPQNVPRIR